VSSSDGEETFKNAKKILVSTCGITTIKIPSKGPCPDGSAEGKSRPADEVAPGPYMLPRQKKRRKERRSEKRMSPLSEKVDEEDLHLFTSIKKTEEIQPTNDRRGRARLYMRRSQPITSCWMRERKCTKPSLGHGN